MDIKTFIDHWNLINFRSGDHYKSSTLLLHHIIQFVAIAGEYLMLKKTGDSKVPLKWLPERNLLLGRWIDAKISPLRVALKLPELQLRIYKPLFKMIDHFYIPDHSKAEIYEWLKHTLYLNGVDIRSMHMEMPYELPHHSTDDGQPFQKPHKEELWELCALRSNAQRVIKYFSESFHEPCSIGICPEYFHSECHISLHKNAIDKVSPCVKLGLAVPNRHIDYHYFYVIHWPSKDTIEYYLNLKKLDGGGHWADVHRLQAILPLYEIYRDHTPEAQAKRVIAFFDSALKHSFEMLKANR